jgi:hypothetical protein
MEDDVVHASAAGIEGAEHRRILVSLGRQLVELPARHLAHVDQMRRARSKVAASITVSQRN